MTKLNKFILAIVFQVVVILAIIIFKVSIVMGGTEVLLKIQPIDPTSPLRGDYVSFRYDISSLDSYLLGDSQVRSGDTVYVVLDQSGTYWKAQSVGQSKPANKDQIFLKGKVTTVSDLNQKNPRIHVVYGAEEYFIPEGKGRNFNFTNKEVAASVSVDDSGNAVIKQLYIDNKIWP